MWQPTLLTTVFCTGACVLILEVLSTRILAPFFGNTIFAFSSIIGVTLAALSIGYYTGGLLADRRPYRSWFFGIILLSGVTVFLTKLLSVRFLPPFAGQFSLVWGPLFFSVILFTLPCVLLGMLSPYAIRLAQSDDRREGVGSLSGKIFFWSTLGSIAGTFLAGFFLIPAFGVQSILAGLGGFLVLLGAAGLSVLSRSRRILMLLGMCVALSTLLAVFSRAELPPGVVHAEEGIYESIVVQDVIFNGETIRLLLQNNNRSSAIALGTGDLVFDYARYYRLALAMHPEMERVLIIGAGAFTMPNALLNESRAVVDVVDPEPHLRALARQYFNVQENDRLRSFVTDGRSFLRERPDRYDLIFSDAYQNFHAIPPHLLTREFFQEGRRALSDRGVFIVNVVARNTPAVPSLFWSAARTFRSVFPQSAFFAVQSPDVAAVQNFLFLGCARAECSDPCGAIRPSRKSAFLRDACAKQLAIDDAALERYALLTDDYAPVEYLAARAL